MNAEQEALCQAIDRRMRDKAAVAQAERALEPPQLFWTGNIYISTTHIQGVLVTPIRMDTDRAR